MRNLKRWRLGSVVCHKLLPVYHFKSARCFRSCPNHKTKYSYEIFGLVVPLLSVNVEVCSAPAADVSSQDWMEIFVLLLAREKIKQLVKQQERGWKRLILLWPFCLQGRNGTSDSSTFILAPQFAVWIYEWRTAQTQALKNPSIVVLVLPQSGYFKNHKGMYF